MKMENTGTNSGDMMLGSPAGTPFSFAVIIKGMWPLGNSTCDLQVKGIDPQTAVPKTNGYHLHNREHGTYLDLFAQLSADFGLRLPRNRQPPEQYNFQAVYREVCWDATPMAAFL